MIRILDPTLRAPSTAAEGSPAPRPSRLAGATVGLLANGKSNGMVILDRLAEILRERHGIGDVLRVAKTNASTPVSAEDAERLAKRCTAIITAIGD
jgi:hypothetical protein